MKSRTLFAAIAACVMLFASSLALAIELPSSISGAYRGTDRSCTIKLSDAGTYKLGELKCLVWQSGDVIDSINTVHANGVCPDSESYTIPFRSLYVPIPILPDTPALRIVAFDDTTLTVRVGPQGEIVMGGGELQTWQRDAALTVPTPYTCSTPLPTPPRTRPALCGDFGWFCG